MTMGETCAPLRHDGSSAPARKLLGILRFGDKGGTDLTTRKPATIQCTQGLSRGGNGRIAKVDKSLNQGSDQQEKKTKERYIRSDIDKDVLELTELGSLLFDIGGHVRLKIGLGGLSSVEHILQEHASRS